MTKTIFGKIKDKFSDLLSKASKEIQKKAIATYQLLARRLTDPVTGNRLMDENRSRLQTRLYPQNIGRMIMFYYDPKLKEKLPYYDRFPLVIPIEFYPDGFLGLNLHYLPPNYRARLMDALYNTIISDKYTDETKRIRISYNIVKNVSRTRLYEPCVKRYLTAHIRSKFMVIEPENWQIALFLPTERFEKQDKKVVWNDSISKFRKGRI